MSTAPRPPADLGEAGRKLWRETVREWDLGAADLLLLAEACSCADRCDQLRQAAVGQPAMITGRLLQVLPNPVFAELRAERRTLLSLLGGLGLLDEPAEERGRLAPVHRLEAVQ